MISKILSIPRRSPPGRPHPALDLELHDQAAKSKTLETAAYQKQARSLTERPNLMNNLIVAPSFNG